jgi:hypothetical protein
LNSNVGDPLATLVIDFIFDQLDAANVGECLICNELLSNPSPHYRSADYLLQKDCTNNAVTNSFRSACYHCYHMDCLCMWGAVTHMNNLSSKISKAKREKENVKIRSVEGDLKSQVEAKRLVDVEITRLQEQISEVSGQNQFRGKSICQ